MTDNAPNHPQNTQVRRRLKYGLNVAFALVAALVLALFVNWISYRHFYQRIDLTAGQRYSLSQQTTQLLSGLEGEHEIVAMFRIHDTRHERVLSLLREYERYNDGLTVTHIDPYLDIAQRDRFYQRLIERHQDGIQPVKDAIKQSRAQVAQLFDELAAMETPLQQIASNPDFDNPQLEAQLRQLIVWVSQSNATTLQDAIEEALESPLPAYETALTTLQQPLGNIDQNLQTAERWFKNAVGQEGVPNAAQDTLLGLAQQIAPMRQQAQELQRELESVSVPEPYSRLRSNLTSSEPVVVMGPNRERILPVSELYREVDPRFVQSEGEPQTQFLTEEKVTGTLMSLQLEQAPLVVFVYTGQQAPLGQRGSHTQVAERLRSANFEVTQWNPTSGGQQTGPMGGMGGGASAPPEPREGQQTVWIVLNSQPQNPMMAMAGSQGEQQVVEHLTERLTAGDSAMILLGMDVTGGMAGTSPKRQMVETWGITPLLDRQILREVQRGDGQTQPVAAHIITNWSNELAITQALEGLSAVFIEASPLTLREPEGMDVQHWPLVELRSDRMWAERVSAGGGDNIGYDQSSAADAFTVAVAAESEDKRLIVAADPRWPSDRITNMGYNGMPAMFTGAQFPGNSELFVNSVYWLSGLDQMIAASPRSQDIRRIEAMSDTAVNAYRWSLLVGMPIVVLAAGMGVWFVRRRG